MSMGEYFKPWHRKIGVLTLVMACVFASGWVRSFSTFDRLQWRSDEKGICLVTSNRGLLLWEGVEESIPFQLTLPSFYLTGDATTYNFLDNGQHVTWHWGSCGFEFGETTFRITGWSKAFRIIPYWSIVVPLTLLSAYLLLSKPRPAKKPETA
jgi:hypothetical protein